MAAHFPLFVESRASVKAPEASPARRSLSRRGAWAEPYQRQSRRLQHHLVIEAASMPVMHIAALHGLSWATVRRAEEHEIARWELTRPAVPLRHVGVDEKWLGRAITSSTSTSPSSVTSRPASRSRSARGATSMRCAAGLRAWRASRRPPSFSSRWTCTSVLERGRQHARRRARRDRA
jgi:Helix-turn-helix domain of transposase family ISL3